MRCVPQGVYHVPVETLLIDFLDDLQACQHGRAALQPPSSILPCCQTDPVSNCWAAAGQGMEVNCRMDVLVCA